MIDRSRHVLHNAPVEPAYEEFGQQLKAARTKARISQGELAKRVGLTRTSITNIEHGKQRVPLHLFLDLAHAVGVEPHLLLPAPQTTSRLDAVMLRRLRPLSEPDQEWVKQIVSDAEQVKAKQAKAT